MRFLARAIALLALAGSAHAEPLAFGARTLEVPAPEGFVGASRDVPQFVAISQAYLPASNRLVEVYISPDDLAAFTGLREPTLARYFQLQAARNMEGRAISAEGFEQARGIMEAELEKALSDTSAMTRELTEKGNAQLQETTGSQAKLSFGGIRYLGVTRREPWGLFFALESNVAVTGDPGGQQGGKVVSAGALVLVNHQLLNLYAYANDAPDAGAWTQGAVNAWADAVRAANPDDPAVAREAVDLAGNTDLFRWGGMIGGAVAGLLVAFAILAVRRMKNS